MLSPKDSCGAVGLQRRASHVRLQAEGAGFLEEVILEENFVGGMEVRPRRLGNERSYNKRLALNAISVRSGCCNETPQTAWLINSRNLFPTVLMAEKSKIKVPAESIYDESPLSRS